MGFSRLLCSDRNRRKSSRWTPTPSPRGETKIRSWRHQQLVRVFAASVLIVFAILCYFDDPPSSYLLGDDHGESLHDLRSGRRHLLSWKRKKWLRRQERLEKLARLPAVASSSSSLAEYMDPKSVALRTDAEAAAREQMLVETASLEREFDLQAKASQANALAEGATTFSVRSADAAADAVSSFFQPSEVLIEIVNPKPAYTYSVTIVSYGKYTGTARLMEGYEFHSSETLVHSWTPPFPGLYHVLVHELARFGKVTPLIEPVNHPFLVQEGQQAQPGAGLALLEQRIQTMPPCQTVPDTHVYSHWEGDWLGPDFQLEDSIRTGWGFLPSPAMGCKVETFTREMMRAIPTKKKIYVLGRSVERGVFLSLVDMMLDRREKWMFRKSDLMKCWGRATVAKGNLEVMYQDFRVSSFEDPRKPRYIECHNEKMVKRPGSSFIANATEVWEEMFDRNVPGEWPSVVFMVTGLGAMHFRFSYHVHEFVKMLPREWTGTLFLGDFSFSARGAGLANVQQYQKYLRKVSELVDLLDDPRVRWFDGVGLSKEMRMYGQKGEEKVAGSQHFHRPCGHYNEHGEYVAVCSNVTELVGQVLLGHALGPKSEFLGEVERNPLRTPPATKPRVCTACPECMLPFHIAPRPDMKCKVGPIEKRTYAPQCGMKRWEEHDGEGESGGAEANALVCPEACMETPSTSSFETESDTVFVRQCPIP